MLADDQLAKLLKDVRHASDRFPDAPWTDALSFGQLSSKAWLVAELGRIQTALGKVHILGGWLGTLSLLMLNDERIMLSTIRSFDQDSSCEGAADMLNISFYDRFKAITQDIQDLTFEPSQFVANYGDGSRVEHSETPDTVINTSCDHMSNEWFARVPAGTLVAIQNNDFHHCDETHTQTVSSLEEFKQQYDIGTLLFEGTKQFPMYTRFMLIGWK